MKASQRVALEMSEKREKLNALLAVDELTEDQRDDLGKLTSRLQELEVEARAAILAEGETTVTKTTVADGESDELRSLIGRANIGAIFEATLEHRATSGVEAELQAHYRVAANTIPLALLQTEHRAVTAAPGQVAQNQAAIIPGVFPMSCAAFLAVDMPTVATGDAVFPVLSTNANVGVPAENATQAETTGSFSADVLSPGRLQASFFYSREDRARFSGMDTALRSNLSDALSDSLDKQILVGTEGLLTGSKLPNNNVTAVTSYASYRAELGYARVDGTFAGSVGDIRIVMGAKSLRPCSGPVPFRQRWRPSRIRRPDGRHRRRQSFGSCSGCCEQQAEHRGSAGIAPGYGRRNLGRNRPHSGRADSGG